VNQERTIEEDRKRPGGLTRRTFFKTAVAGAAFTVAAFMHPTTPAEAEEVAQGGVARFIIGSDLHVPSYDSTTKLPKIFSWMATMSPSRVCLVGDITDNGRLDQYATLNGIINASPISRDRFVFCQGNHETFDPGVLLAPARFKDQMGQDANKLISVAGIPVITLGPNTLSDQWYHDDLSFFQECMDTIDNDDGTTYTRGMPILLLCHHSISDTAYTSEEWNGDYGNDLIDAMKTHHQIIHVSGHSHATVEDARSIDQSLGFTCIQDATLSAYFENERYVPFTMYDPTSGEVSSYPQAGDNFNKAAQCIVIDVLQNGDAVVTRYDLYPLMEGGQARTLFESWTIETSQMIDDPQSGAYQKARVSTAAPKLPQSGAVTVSDGKGTSFAVSFPAFTAGSDSNLDVIHDYRITAQPVDASGTDSGDAQVRRCFSDYFVAPEKRHDHTGEAWKVVVAGLLPATSYKVSVCAETSFYQNDATTGASQPLVFVGLATTKTIAIPDAIIDVDFRRGNASDAMGHTLRPDGGSIVSDTTLVAGSSTSVFETDGTHGYGYTLDADDYGYFKGQSTTECLFKMVDVQSDQCVFSNQQSAGAGLEIEDGNLEFWYNKDSGGKVKPSAAINANEWVYAVAVADGTNVTLYVNGVQAAQVAAGAMKVPSPKTYWVGSDTSAADKDDEYQCKAGTRVALARLYPKALTAAEIKQRYEDLTKPVVVANPTIAVPAGALVATVGEVVRPLDGVTATGSDGTTDLTASLTWELLDANGTDVPVSSEKVAARMLAASKPMSTTLDTAKLAAGSYTLSYAVVDDTSDKTGTATRGLTLNAASTGGSTGGGTGGTSNDNGGSTGGTSNGGGTGSTGSTGNGGTSQEAGSRTGRLPSTGDPTSVIGLASALIGSAGAVGAGAYMRHRASAQEVSNALDEDADCED